MKRIVSIVLTLCLLLGNFAPAAYAQESSADATVNTGDVTVEGTNSIGSLLSAEITEIQEESSTAQLSGYVITDLTVEGNTATVTYDAMDYAAVVVALYTEDGMQMLTSANTTVSPEKTETTVTFAGEMPQYFLARAFLVDNTSLTPLSEAYETPMYTQVMQELLNSTVDDYDPELVVNFDENPATNFAVYNDDVVRVEELEGVNTVVTNDDENLLYVIENADETFTALQPGDVVSYLYGDDQMLLAKVASLTVNGTTVTIHGDSDMEIEDVFSCVKMEEQGGTADFSSTDLDSDDGISLLEEPGTAPVLYGSGDNDVTIDKKYVYEIDKRELPVEDNSKITAEVSGTFSIDLKLNAAFYLSGSYRYLRLKLDYTLEFAINAEGRIKLPLENFAYLVLLRTSLFRFTLSPTFVFTVSGKIDFTASIKGTVGFTCESGRDMINLNTNPKMEMQAEINSTITASLDFQPEFTVIHEKVASVVLSVPITGVAEMQHVDLNIYDDSLTGTMAESVHDCVSCIEGKYYWKITIDFEIKFLKLTEKLQIELHKSKEEKFWYSLDYETGGVGECPYKLYLVVFEILSKEDVDAEAVYSPVEGATIKAADLVLYSDAEGLAYGYLEKGINSVTVTAEEVSDQWSLNVKDGGQKMKIIFDEEEMQFGYYVDDFASEEVVDTSAAIDSGSCGDDVQWVLFGSGVLNIYGSGEMSRFNSASDVPWHKYRSDILNVIISCPTDSVPRR